MTNTNKMTYVTALTYAIENLTDAPADVLEKLTALKEQTEKRNAADHKPTKTQQANVGLQDRILEVLGGALEPLTVTEIMARDEELSKLSNQKVSALIRTLGAKVIKTTDKRVSKFARA